MSEKELWKSLAEYVRPEDIASIKEFGGKDHTTVLHAIDKIENQLAEDDNLQDDIRNLRMELQP